MKFLRPFDLFHEDTAVGKNLPPTIKIKMIDSTVAGSECAISQVRNGSDIKATAMDTGTLRVIIIGTAINARKIPITAHSSYIPAAVTIEPTAAPSSHHA